MSDLSQVQSACGEADVLRAVLSALRLARSSYGVTLHGQHPADAWAAHQVDAKLADAAGLLGRLIDVQAADAAVRPVGSVTELVVWVKCSDRMPDAETTVLAYLPPDENDTEGMVISAWFDGEQWRGASDGWPLGKAVTWWAPELQGPGAAA